MEIANCMKSRNMTELSKMLSLSKNLASTAKFYWDNFDTNYCTTPTGTTTTSSNTTTGKDNYIGKPCIFAFSGPAYKGINIHEIIEMNQRTDSTGTSSSANSNTPNNSYNIFEYMQSNLQILDPLSGVLCPLDIIQPYRLEKVRYNAKKQHESSDEQLKTRMKQLGSWNISSTVPRRHLDSL